MTGDGPSQDHSSGRSFGGVFRYSGRALALVWTTNRQLAIALGLLTLIAGMLPAAMAYVGQLIIDSVVAAMAAQGGVSSPTGRQALVYIAAEGGLVAALTAAQRGISLCQALLRAQLGQRVNELILQKALTMELAQFEDAEFYDKLTRARREASVRPLSLVQRAFGLFQNAISLVSYAVLLAQFSLWAVLLLLVAGLPAFLAEARFAGQAFALFRWRSPETRMQMYLETVLAREDHAKEVKLYELGKPLLKRYADIFARLYLTDRNLALRRDGWGYLLGLVGTVAFYGAYAWIAVATMAARITLGQMTMYLLLFRQGQAAVTASLSAISGMYEDNLYLSNLYEFLGQEVTADTGKATSGTLVGDGLRFQGVSFVYPGQEDAAVSNVSFHLRPGQSLALVGENGAGKTTLVKLLTRLYRPTSGRILLDGVDLQEWDRAALRARIGVVFQDFNRYQFPVGENIGAGDVSRFHDRPRWAIAARKGLAEPFIEQLPHGYDTQLGTWFKQGRELSGGQWQKIALSRAFMRSGADILVLDEPTAAMDAAAEARIFDHFRQTTHDKLAILISHRFSTVRMADEILVMGAGRIIERGSHAALIAAQGAYARLFALQARGYR